MKKNLPFIILLFFSLSTFSQKNYWKEVYTKDVASFTKGKELFYNSFKPSVYKLFSLNTNDLSTFLKQAPHEKNTPVKLSNFIVAIPVANGNMEKFRITESPVMSPELQAKYP